MKKIAVILIFLFTNSLFSQEDLNDNVVTKPAPVQKDTSWKIHGLFGLNFSQTLLSNWQGGGQNNIAFNGIVNFEPNYQKGKDSWTNKLDAQFGIILQEGSKFWKKNVDQILAVSQFNVLATKKYLYYSVMADFRSQFAPGYQYSGDTSRTLFSNWAAPAYIQLALGMEVKVEDYFSVTVSPLAGKITIVNDQVLADNGDFGVQKAERDTAGNIITHGKKIRYEFGGRVTVKFKKELNKNISIDTYADFFSNYFHNPQNIDIVWNTLLNIKITKYFSTMLSLKMVYDDDIIIKYDANKDGKYESKGDINGPRTQWLANFGFGFGYKF